MTVRESAVGFAAVFAATALCAGVATTDLWPPDETRYAEISRQMTADRSWVLPRLNGTPFIEEPSLFYWLQAASFRVFGGPTASAARVPAVLGALAGVAVTAAFAAEVGVRPAIAVGVLATSPEYWWMARSATPDTSMAAASAAALLLFLMAWRTGRSAPLVGAAFAAAVAFWLKSLLPVGLAACVAIAFVARAGRGKLRAGPLGVAALVVAVLLGAWVVVLVAETGREGAYFFLVTNHLGRLRGEIKEGHIRPVLYYAWNLPVDLLPWSLLLPALAARAWRDRADLRSSIPTLWVATMVAVLTLSSSKRAHYLLPAYPAFAVAIAAWWQRTAGAWTARVTRWAFSAVIIGSPAIVFLVTAGHFEKLVGQPAGSVWELVRVAAASITPSPTAAIAAALCAVPVAAYVSTVRRRDGTSAVAAATLALAIVHLVTVWVVLPRFDAVVSPRPLGERLAAAGARGAELAAFGFPSPEQLSGLMFYARRRIPLVSLDEAKDLLARRACLVVAKHRRAKLGVLPDRVSVWRGEGRGPDVDVVATEGAGCVDQF